MLSLDMHCTNMQAATSTLTCKICFLNAMAIFTPLLNFKFHDGEQMRSLQIDKSHQWGAFHGLITNSTWY